MLGSIESMHSYLIPILVYELRLSIPRDRSAKLEHAPGEQASPVNRAKRFRISAGFERTCSSYTVVILVGLASQDATVQC